MIKKYIERIEKKDLVTTTRREGGKRIEELGKVEDGMSGELFRVETDNSSKGCTRENLTLLLPNFLIQQTPENGQKPQEIFDDNLPFIISRLVRRINFLEGKIDELESRSRFSKTQAPTTNSQAPTKTIQAPKTTP